LATLVNLVRHAEPDWDLMQRLGWRGPAADLVPLTRDGLAQAAATAAALHATGAKVVVSSPMPRALHTAAIVAAAARLPLMVEFDLREWLPHVEFAWRDSEDARVAYEDMIAAGGEREPGSPARWEPLSSVRSRSLAAIRRHAGNGKTIIVVCHQVVIHSLTGHQKTPHAGIRTIELPEEPDGTRQWNT
jgi:broad specificity phosphatase PhoE